MRPDLVRVSALPAGWAVCRARGRRRAVMAWAIFEEDGVRTTVGLIARGSTLVRGDRVHGFTGYAAGPGTEPQLEPPVLPPADLNEAMAEALAVIGADWSEYETRIRSALTAAADTEWATTSLAGFDMDPGHWVHLWLAGRHEHEDTEAGLWLRLRALSLVAPGRSLESALDVAGISLGQLLAAPPPPSAPHEVRRSPAGGTP